MLCCYGSGVVLCWYGPSEMLLWPLSGVGVGVGVSLVWCDTAVVGGAQGSSGEQRLWCEPVAAGRTPRRESNTETGRGVISSYSGAPDILVHLVYWCIKPDLTQRYNLKARPRGGRATERQARGVIF